jgi:hypothetical protein
MHQSLYQIILLNQSLPFNPNPGAGDVSHAFLSLTDSTIYNPLRRASLHLIPSQTGGYMFEWQDLTHPNLSCTCTTGSLPERLTPCLIRESYLSWTSMHFDSFRQIFVVCSGCQCFQRHSGSWNEVLQLILDFSSFFHSLWLHCSGISSLSTTAYLSLYFSYMKY